MQLYTQHRYTPSTARVGRISSGPACGPAEAKGTMHMIRKGQARWVSGSDIRRQIHFINKLFEVAA